MLNMQHWVFSLFLQESLRKITHTLALKNEEISNFVCTLKQSLDNLEVQTRTWMNYSVISVFPVFTLFYVVTPGELQQSPGGPGVWVHLPPLCSGRDEGKHADAYQTGASQPHVRAAGKFLCSWLQCLTTCGWDSTISCLSPQTCMLSSLWERCVLWLVF